MKLLVATKNPAKLKEISKYLGPQFDLVYLPPTAPDVEETGLTFEENATIKSYTSFVRLGGGVAVVADDGGLEIDYLNGEPGVHSRRWPGYPASDWELVDLALEKLKGVPLEKRTAHLRAVGAFRDSFRTITVTESISGHIVSERPRHIKERGYPFRAIFWVPQFGKMFQDLTEEEHEQINHRRKMYRELGRRIVEASS